ncbi:head-tail adaptor protein [Fimbriiglobus ruber]|uniref:Phage protein n=1 Tax=Fimbriiglobus ruber TaxID=1908690 RepID=A0A225D8W0_9BACT|nr:head-tail adaptor protein [Fimbriiglobus ruber]OWK37892.1 hypothetical protein FRUB_07012 [Fimbriiglobus ruber]
MTGTGKPGAGEYRWRFEWLVCVRTPDGVTGDNPKSYPSTGNYLWGNYSAQSSNEQDKYGAIRTVTQGEVRVRGFPNISAEDRLYYFNFGETYDVTGVRRDFENYETVLDVESVNTSNG